mmetsp:Transcript_14556/g.29100  ORF Transcript_14556/g.29100 Transcript_14556/m.29100 type:complete len:246 (-) Transcript_14556:93-830(-)
MLAHRLCAPIRSAIPRAVGAALAHNRMPPQQRGSFGHLASLRASGSRGIHDKDPNTMYATTILCVRKGDKVVMIGDGQVTQGSYVVKDSAKKVRRLQNGNVITGFAGAAVDALTLCEKLEAKLEQYPQLMRACVELAKEWRSDKNMRRMLNAVLIVADKDLTMSVSGTGDLLEPINGVCGIGSGGIYAQCAAQALIDIDGLSAEDIARKAMKVASDTCIYTNHNYVVEIIDVNAPPAPKDAKDAK